MVAGIEIINARQVQKTLKNISKDIKKVEIDALTKAGFIVERNVKKLTPVVTGRLRGSVHTVRKKDSAVVGTNVEYGSKVEYGVCNKHGFKDGHRMFHRGLANSRKEINTKIPGLFKKTTSQII